jgi:hypothetical protein
MQHSQNSPWSRWVLRGTSFPLLRCSFYSFQQKQKFKTRAQNSKQMFIQGNCEGKFQQSLEFNKQIFIHLGSSYFNTCQKFPSIYWPSQITSETCNEHKCKPIKKTLCYNHFLQI